MKTAEFRFGLNGVVSKEDPALLKDGQYRSLVNCEVLQEGGVASSTGSLELGNVGTGISTVAYRAQKMVLSPTENPTVPSTNPRYIGVTDNSGINLWRTADYNSFTKVASGINSSGGVTMKRFQLASYTAGETGNPWAFIAAEKAMLKDNGNSLYSTLHNWGILPASNVCTATNAGAGNLDGGDPASPPGSTAYDWRYTYNATDTNNEGNPSQTMLADSAVSGGAPLSGHNFTATVTGYGTGDPQIGFINIYRRGGTLFDTWRQVGQVANPGAGSTWTLTDNISDADLLNNTQINLYNDPPVPSTVPKPITGSLAAIASPGRQTVNLTLGTLAGVTAGTTLHLFYDNPEDVVIEAVNSTTQFVAYFQHTHSANADFEIDTIVNQPCTLAIQYQQFILVAGDPNNPHLIYRSTGGMPESFPPVPADGTTAIAACGSPSDPILAMTEFRGAVVTLNASSIFETLIINGTLIQGTRVATKGLVAPFAWCKTANEIWFLSTDGVYSWDGSSCRKRSEAIDPFFHNQQLNGMPPLDLVSLNAPVFGTHAPPCMIYYRGEIHLECSNGSGIITWICEPMYGDRWRLHDILVGGQLQIIYTEEDTGSQIYSTYNSNYASFLMDDQQEISGGINYTTEGFSSGLPLSGGPVDFDIRLPWFDFNDPFSKKLLSEALLDLDLSNSNASNATLAVDILVDYADNYTLFAADSAAVDTLTVSLATPPGRGTPISLLPALESVGGKVQALGREIRAVSFHIYGAAWPVRMNFYRLFFRYEEIGQITAGGPGDWTDLGYKWDKKLYQFTVVFDVAGVGQTIALDIIYGPGSGTYIPAAQTFVLNNPVLSDSSPGRASQNFAISGTLNGSNSVAKLVRVRPYAVAPSAAVGAAAASTFKIISVDFGQFEQYPPDVTLFTPWETGGSEYLKYANQLDLEVNTNNVAIVVEPQADGAPVIVGSSAYTFSVQTTESARTANIALPPGITGYEWRLWLNPSQAGLIANPGMFQLFRHRFSFQPADRGDIQHSMDWDSLGHPFDKYLLSITVEWDFSLSPANSSVTLQLDIINGIGGGNLVPNVAQFKLSGNRSKATFPIPANTIAKLIRLYPITTPLPTGMRQWKYECASGSGYIPYPPDTILSTDWRDAKSDDDKNPSWLFIDADTQNIPCRVVLQNETGTALTVTQTGTNTNRKFNYAIPVDTYAKMWRLLTTPGANGKFQVFGWGFARWAPFSEQGPIDPPEIVLATPWRDFEYPYPKEARILTVVVNTGGVTCQIQLESMEGGIVQTFPVNTTYTTRRQILSCNANLSGTEWRLRLSPGVGGIAMLWNWDLNYVKMPPALTTWNSYGQGLGYKGYKVIKQSWLDYICAGPVNVTITSDTGIFTIQLPAQPTRGVQRFYPGTVWGAGLNKSTLYTLNIAAANPSDPFQMFADLSGLEWIACGADRHAGYRQTRISEFDQVAI